jgi:hypothetical protein
MALDWLSWCFGHRLELAERSLLIGSDQEQPSAGQYECGGMLNLHFASLGSSDAMQTLLYIDSLPQCGCVALRPDGQPSCLSMSA